MTEHSGSNPVKLMSLLFYLRGCVCISKLNAWDCSLAVGARWPRMGYSMILNCLTLQASIVLQAAHCVSSQKMPKNCLGKR